MAKKKSSKKAKSKPAAIIEPPAPEVQPAAVTSEPERVFGFLTKSRCPRCGSTNTRAYSTQGRVQYRQCQIPICRRKYVQYGQKV